MVKLMRCIRLKKVWWYNMSKKRLVRGVGINDACYTQSKYEIVEGFYSCGRKKFRIVWKCPYYIKWVSMLTRCYYSPYLEMYPSYLGCTVCPEWLLFSNFRKWMITQDWEGKDLDKDLLIQGNKVYNLDACTFISTRVNKFLVTNKGKRGNSMIGCYSNKGRGKDYKATCSNVFNPKQGNNLGYFDTESEAHLAWKKQKHIYACALAYSIYVTDDRVRQALLHRYENFDTIEEHLS